MWIIFILKMPSRKKITGQEASHIVHGNFLNFTIIFFSWRFSLDMTQRAYLIISL